MTKIVALDCGHGLYTAGKQTPDKIKEWTLNDKVRDYVVEYLKDYDVKFIHTDNNEGAKDESLATRFNLYIKKKADVMVSIHHNAFQSKWGTHTGVEVFVDKSHTAKDMALAKAIYKYLPKYTGLRGRGIKKENWAVINQNTIPAVLVEGGFMDSTIDYPVITSEKGQRAYARAIADGLIAFCGLEKIKKVEPYKGYLKVLINGLSTHSTPSWSDSTIDGTVNKNDILEVVGRIKVSDVYMYELKNGSFVTSAKVYVEYMKNLPVIKKTLKVGSRVRIKSGAVYGGLSSSRGKAVSVYAMSGNWVVLDIATHKGIKEAKLSNINSWVSTDKLTIL